MATTDADKEDQFDDDDIDLEMLHPRVEDAKDQEEDDDLEMEDANPPLPQISEQELDRAREASLPLSSYEELENTRTNTLGSTINQSEL